jgi:hypothetical protein
VGERVLTRMFDANRACSARGSRPSLGVVLDHLGDRACGGQVAALDPSEERVADHAGSLKRRSPLGGASSERPTATRCELAAQPQPPRGTVCPRVSGGSPATEGLPIDGIPSTSPPSGSTGGLSVLGPGCFPCSRPFPSDGRRCRCRPNRALRPRSLGTGSQVCGSSVKGDARPGKRPCHEDVRYIMLLLEYTAHARTVTRTAESRCAQAEENADGARIPGPGSNRDGRGARHRRGHLSAAGG